MPSPTTTYDWSSGSLPGAVTHGGGANGTKWNVSGNLVAGSAGRITFGPVSHACLGLLMEEARTNLAIQSAKLNTAPWTVNAMTMVEAAVTSPDGGTTGNQATEDATSNGHDDEQQITQTSGNTVAYSAYFKAGTRTTAFVGMDANAGTHWATSIFDLSAPALGESSVGGGSGTIITRGIQNVGNSWRFCYIAGSIAQADPFIAAGTALLVTGNTFNAGGVPTGSGTASVLNMWGAQIEALAQFPSSYIPTTTVAVTRSADTATVASPSAGALKISGHTAIFIGAGQVQTIWSRDDGTAANTIKLIRNASNEIRFQVVTASVSQADILLGTVANDTDFSVSVRWGTNDFAGSLNNAAVATDTSGTVPTTTTDRFGNSAVGADYWMATIARIDYYTTLTNNELQGIFLIPTFRRPVRVRRKARTIRQRRRFVPIAPQAPPVPISFAKPDDVLKRVRRKLPQQPRYVARAVARRHHLSPLLPTPYSISQPAKVQRRIRRKLARQPFSVARAVRERHNLAPIAPQGGVVTPTPFTRRVKFRIRKRTAARRRRFAPVAPQAVVPTPVSFSAAKRAINLRKRKVARQPNRALLRRHHLATVLPPFVPPVVPPLPTGGGGVTVGKPRRYPGVFADFSPKVNPKASPKPVKSEPPLPGAMPVPIPEAYPKYLLGATPGDPRPRALQLIAAAKKKQQDEDDEDAFFILR